MATADRVPVPGSDRSPLPGSVATGPADPDEQATVTVVLRPRAGALGDYTEGDLLPGERATARSTNITSGNDDLTGLGGYSAAPGWDPCTGLGSPDGARLLATLAGRAPVGAASGL